MTLDDELRKAVEAFFSGAHEELLGYVNANGFDSEPTGSYPDLHRIADIRLAGIGIRLLRKTSENEKLFLVTIPEPNEDVPGVPFWLSGNKLAEWAKEEKENPSDEKIDWEKYRL